MAEQTATRQQSSFLVIAVLALLSVFPPLATDMYLSAFKDIQAAYGAADGAMELSLSIFFLGLCMGQLIFGPVIDRVGRRGPLLLGVAVFCASTLVLLLNDNIHLFIALRLVQALGACAGMVVGRAVVSDLFEGREAAKMMTLLVMLMSLGPISAPFIGSLLVTYINWQSVFVVMLVIGLVALGLSWWAIPETLSAELRNKEPLSASLSQYAGILKRRKFLLPSLAGAFVQAGLFAFITTSSSLFIGRFGLTNIQYGLCFGSVTLGLVVASQVNARLLETLSVARIVDFVLPVYVLGGVGLLVVSSTNELLLLLVPLWLSVAMVGLISANVMALAMRASHGNLGAGSALLGALQFGIAFLCSSVVGSFPSAGALPLALGILIPGLAASVLWVLFRRSE